MAQEGSKDASELQHIIENLESCLRRIQRKTATELEDAAGLAGNRQSRNTRHKAEEKILATVRKLKRRLLSPQGSDVGNLCVCQPWLTTKLRDKE